MTYFIYISLGFCIKFVCFAFLYNTGPVYKPLKYVHAVYSGSNQGLVYISWLEKIPSDQCNDYLFYNIMRSYYYETSYRDNLGKLISDKFTILVISAWFYFIIYLEDTQRYNDVV